MQKRHKLDMLCNDCHHWVETTYIVVQRMQSIQFQNASMECIVVCNSIDGVVYVRIILRSGEKRVFMMSLWEKIAYLSYGSFYNFVCHLPGI